VTRKVYVYNVAREDRWWIIHVPELDGMTQARFLGEIDLMARDLISMWIEQDESTFDVELGTFELPGSVDEHVNAALTSWLAADLEAGRAAQELRAAEVGIRDIGRILGVSYVIARKLLANADDVDDARALVDEPADPNQRPHTDAEIEEAAAAFDPGVAVNRWRPLMARPGLAARDVPGHGGHDAEARARARAVARAEWDERIAAARGELDLAAEFRAIGRSWSEVDAQGDLVVKNASEQEGDGVDAWAEVGPFYDAAGAAAVLGVSMSAVRSRRARGSLLALRSGSGSWVFPVWQFVDGQVLPGLGRVLRVLRGSDVSEWTLASWLRSPEVELSGRTPLDVLHGGGEDDLVLLVASHAAAGNSVVDVRRSRQDAKWDRVAAVVKADVRSEQEIEEGLLAQLGLPL